MTEEERLNWAEARIGLYAYWLGVPHAWRINMLQDDVACKSREERAFIYRDPAYLQARLTLSADVEKNERGEETIIHELLHICFAEMEQLMKEVAQQLAPSTADLFQQRFEHIEEQTVTLMARGLRHVFIPNQEDKKVNNVQWWLISNEDVAKIRTALLQLALQHNTLAKDALHTLDSGLNTTDDVPDDFKDEEPTGS